MKLVSQWPPLDHKWRLIDSHIHLDADLYDADRPRVLDLAGERGVQACIVPATNLESSQKIMTLHQADPRLLPAVGIHPHEAQGGADGLDKVRRLADGAIALGETGLEGHYDFCPMPAQLESLRGHMRLARDLDLPLILHCRDTEELLHRELKTAGPFPAGGVVHCFTGTWEWGERFLQLGFHLGVTGIVCFPKADAVHQVAQACPLERLLLETDGPYLTPPPNRGRRNEPAAVADICAAVAGLRGQSVQTVAAAATQATCRLFKRACWPWQDSAPPAER